MSCRTEVFSRVTGFFTVVQRWNPGKVAEFFERKKYDIKKGGDDLQERSKESNDQAGEEK